MVQVHSEIDFSIETLQNNVKSNTLSLMQYFGKKLNVKEGESLFLLPNLKMESSF